MRQGQAYTDAMPPKVVDVISSVLAAIVFLAGAYFVVWESLQHPVPPTAQTTTTTTTTTKNPATTTTEHTATTADQKTTTTDKTTTAAGSETSVTTVVSADQAQSLLERYLTAGHLGLFVLLGIAALAAFLTGAIVQRIGRAEYAITLGPLTLPAIGQAAADQQKAILELTKAVAALKRRARTSTEHVARTVEATDRPRAAEMRGQLEELDVEQDRHLALVDQHLARAQESLRKAGFG